MKTKITLLALAMLTTYALSYGQSSLKVIENGNVGVNTDNPIEKLQVNGAINLGNTTINAPGSIRWTGEDFEGFDGLDWRSLTQCGCDNTEEGNSSNTQTDEGQEETEVQQGNEEEGNEEQSGGDSSDNETISNAGCESTDDIVTADMTLNQDWTNQLNTKDMGFSDEGELCYTISSYVGNTTEMMGLSEDPDIDAKYEHINYAFYHRIVSTLNSHRVYIWENNQRMGIFVNSKESYEGSTFCIRRNADSEIQYFINDELVYTSETVSTRDLYFDNSFYGFSEGSSSIWDHQPSNVSIDDIAVCSETILSLEGSAVATAKLVENSLGILGQNFPNPFHDKTKVRYDLSAEIYGQAEMILTNNLGQIIQRKTLNNHSGEIKIEGSGLSSGIYHYTIYLDGVAMEAKQMLLE